MRRFLVHYTPQRSPEWFQARMGKLTGSRAKDMQATIQKGEAASRRDLRTTLVLERLTGEPQESTFINDDMQWGIDHEEAAIAAYEARAGVTVTRSGFLELDDVAAGCSLDGHLGDYE